ncbi:MAG: Uncharacterised protein [Arcobacter lacus]|nr:MAG: Uncharacterised protein [Arcobacter lacus]
MKKKIITLDEFFKYKQMFSGLQEDKELAWHLYSNSNYQDKEVVDRLMLKALLFKDRVDFSIAVKYSFEVNSLDTNKIYTFIKKSKVDNIYMDILRKLKQ